MAFKIKTAKADKTVTPEAEVVTPEAEVVTPEASDGTPAEEVAERSADVDADESTEHVKEFVLGPGNYTEANGYNHDANKSATRQYMISAGLRPVGDVEHVSTRTHADGKSKILKYKVTAIPAHLASAPEVAHAEVIQGTGDTSTTDAN